MAKQKAFLIVGLPHTGVSVLTAALEEHREALTAQGVRVPAKSADETFRAAVELRCEHRAWGLRRKDVEGTWSAVCRRVHKHPEPAVLGHELLAGAGPAEIALLVDGLAGRQVHAVVLAGTPDGRLGLFPDELDLEGVLERWAGAVRAPDRLHVVVGGAVEGWRELGALVGFDAAALPLPAVVHPPIDVASLRLLTEGSLLDHEELVAVAERWAKVVADGGYALTGDLAALVPAEPASGASVATDERVRVLEDSLTEAVTEVGRLRERVRELEQSTRKRSVRLPGVLVGGA